MKYARSLMLGVATSLVIATGSLAADINAPYVSTYSGGYGFEGFYAGVLLGGFFDNTSNYLTAPDTSAISAGLAVGVNFYLTDSIVGGLEIQGGADFGSTATTFDALALAKIGFAPSNDFLIYAAGGAGVAGGKSVYAFGGGVEVAVMDSISARGEVLVLGPWGSNVDAVKATAGLIWHMQ